MNNPIKKGVVVSVILLFISVSVVPSTGSIVEKKSYLPTFYNENTSYVDGSGPWNYTSIQEAIYYPRGFNFRKTKEMSNIIETNKNNNNQINKVHYIKWSSGIIYVPDNYPTIQSAVENATAGDEIIVRNGTYIENIVVDKPLTIQSDNSYKNCTVKAKKENEYVFTLLSNSVSIIGFKVIGSEEAGIYLYNADYCNISYNRMRDNLYEIKVENSDYNMFFGNILGHFWSPDYFGIQLQNSHHNTIIKNTILELCVWGFGVHLINSNNNSIEQNHLYENNYAIVVEESSNSNIISNNSLDSNFHGGIYLYKSDHNTVVYNVINDTYWDGIYLHYSNNTLIINNNLIHDGIFVFYSYYNAIENNTANGKPIIYLEDESDIVICEDAGEIILVNCENISIQRQDISNVENGIELWMTCKSTISECKIYSNQFEAIWLAFSDDNKIYSNELFSNLKGIGLHYSDGNEIYSNNIRPNRWEAIYLKESHLNKIRNNTVKGYDCDGISLSTSNENSICYNEIYSHINSFSGIELYKSEFNNISHNIIYNNSYGMDFYRSHNNNVANNIISNNELGFALHESYYNVVKYNNFIKDSASFTYLLYDFPFSNVWRNNYWGKIIILKIIYGKIYLSGIGIPSFSWINVDWHPAREPYDI